MNTYTGATTVSAGALSISGSLGVAPATAAAAISVGVAGGGNATLNIQSGANIRLNATNMLVGNGITTTAGQGFVYQSGGAVSGMNQLQLGAGASGSSYGYYNLSGNATVSLQELDLGGFNGAAVGVLDMAGGTMNVSNWIVPARGTNGTGILNMTGGVLNFTGPAGQFEGNWNGGTTGTFVINVANASLIAAPANLNLMQTGGSGKLGEVNLLAGGLLQVNSIAPGSATGANVVNFEGGTLQANAATTTFLTTNVTAANVYGSGGTINNNGVAITIPVALCAPAGSGLNSAISVTSGGSGYLGAPAVTFSGGGGNGAAGYATVSGGTVSGIVITSPGTGYASAPTITLTGGGGSGATFGTITPTANTGGGLTFTGNAMTTLSGANTYSGGTTISAGTLQYGVANALLSSGSINVNGAVLDLGGFSPSAGAVTLTAGTIQNGTLTGSSYYANSGLISASLGGASSALTVASGVVTLTGSNGFGGGTTIAGGTLNINNDNNLGSSGGGLAFTGNGTLQQAATASVRLGSGRAISIAKNVTATIDTQGNAMSIAGAISGSGGLTKVSAGTLTLSGSNTYSGVTNVNAGGLYVNGSLLAGGIVNVNAGMLGGSGIVGQTTVASGGTIDVSQNGANSFSLASLTFNGAGTINLGELTNFSSVPALTISGALTTNAPGVSLAFPTNVFIPSGTYTLATYAPGSLAASYGITAFGTYPQTVGLDTFNLVDTGTALPTECHRRLPHLDRVQ